MRKTLKIIGIIFLGLFVLGTIIRIAQPIVKSSLKYQIELANSDCPIPLAGGVLGYISAIKLENGYVTYHINYEKGYSIVNMLNDNPEVAKEIFYLNTICLNGQNNQGKMFIDWLLKENVGAAVVMNEDTVKFTCQLSPSYMREMNSKIELNPSEALHRALKLQMSLEAVTLPLKVDEGLYVAAMYLEDNNIVSEISVDENIYDYNILKDNRTIFEEEILNDSDPSTIAMLDLCKISHSGIIYRIKGSQSNQYFDVLISSDKIRRMHPTPSQVQIN